MTIYDDLYLHRLKKDEEDFFIYDEIPNNVRTQIFHLLVRYNTAPSEPAKFLCKTLSNQFGLLISKNCKSHAIGGYTYSEAQAKTDLHYFLIHCDIEILLTIIELNLKKIKEYFSIQKIYQTYYEKFVKDLNDIFRINRVGYEIKNEIVIRIDSKYLHREVVKKSLNSLLEEGFEAPLKDFEKALEKYSKGDYDGTITSANSAFEGTMKSILGVKTGDATNLITKLISNGLIPPYFENMGIQIKNIFQALPSMRNIDSDAHGEKDHKETQRSYSEFALHLSGSYIVFLIERYKEQDT